MIVDRLILHHNYDGSTAFDVSQNHNHGLLEGVHPSGGVVHFDGGGDCVRVPAAPLLRSMRAVRTSVRFKLQPTAKRRYNLIEGYLSFALVIDDDNSLHGTINNKWHGWIGAQSAPGTVSPDRWHEATMVHDGFSSIRIDLDGVTVAESLATPGPVTGVQAPLGLCIGHWAGDDRYSFIGDIDDVRVWIDRPDAGRDLVDRCCTHGEVVDDLFASLRVGDSHGPFDREVYRNAGEVMRELGAKTFGALASGGESDRTAAWDLARRFVLAYTRGDLSGFSESVGIAAWRTMQKVPWADLQADMTALADALRPTALGPLIDDVLKGTTVERQSELAEKLGAHEWLGAFCAGWGIPPRSGRDGERDGHGSEGAGSRDPRSHGRGDSGGDPATDHDPQEVPPGWGVNARPADDGLLNDRRQRSAGIDSGANHSVMSDPTETDRGNER